jgi:hypothetical protein
VPEKEQDLELRKMFIAIATVTSDAAVNDDVTTSSSLVEYAEKNGTSASARVGVGKSDSSGCAGG